MITDISSFSIISLQPLKLLTIQAFGLNFTLKQDGQLALNADKENERAAIERLLNQDLYSAVYRLSVDRSRQGGKPFKAIRHRAGWVEIEETQPSERIRVNSDYLDLFKTLRLIPELLPNGQVILGLSLGHKICARNGITLDWVIKNRKGWLPNIKRVHHRYSNQGQAPAVADFCGLVADKTAESLVPGTELSLYKYHASKNNFLQSNK